MVASELLVGALTPNRERALHRGLLDPFRMRRRLHTPSWSTWELATSIDRRVRRSAARRTKLRQRSFFHDILIAASARQLGATIVTLNPRDFAIIAQQVDITFTAPWPARAG